jgi:hypothetical protein
VNRRPLRQYVADGFAALAVALLFVGAGGHTVEALTLDETFWVIGGAFVSSIIGGIIGGFTR